MKAILVMEMPESCSECQLHLDVCGGATIICCGCDCENMERNILPDWCPLVPMPEKQSYADLDEDADEGELTFAYRSGWNDCLKAMEGRKP